MEQTHKSSCSFKSETDLGHLYLYRHDSIERCRELVFKGGTDWFRMPVALCSSVWVRVNVSYGVDFQIPIQFIAPPYALAAHLDVRSDARLCLEMVVKRACEESHSQPWEQSDNSSPDCSPPQGLYRNRHHVMPFSPFLSPLMLWSRWSCCRPVLPDPVDAGGRQRTSSPERKYNRQELQEEHHLFG